MEERQLKAERLLAKPLRTWRRRSTSSGVLNTWADTRSELPRTETCTSCSLRWAATTAASSPAGRRNPSR